MEKLSLYDLWIDWSKHLNIPEDEFKLWCHCPKKVWHCEFCGQHGSLEDTFQVSTFSPKIVGYNTILGCPRCRGYKGVTPCIPSYCDCWQLDVVRRLAEGELYGNSR